MNSRKKKNPGSFITSMGLSGAADATIIPVPSDKECRMSPMACYVLSVMVCGPAKTEDH